MRVEEDRGGEAKKDHICAMRDYVSGQVGSRKTDRSGKERRDAETTGEQQDAFLAAHRVHRGEQHQRRQTFQKELSTLDKGIQEHQAQ